MDLFSWVVLSSVLFFILALLIGVYYLNKKEDVDSTIGNNIAVGWFIVVLLIMSYEYYEMKVGGLLLLQ